MKVRPWFHPWCYSLVRWSNHAMLCQKKELQQRETWIHRLCNFCCHWYRSGRCRSDDENLLEGYGKEGLSFASGLSFEGLSITRLDCVLSIPGVAPNDLIGRFCNTDRDFRDCSDFLRRNQTLSRIIYPVSEGRPTVRRYGPPSLGHGPPSLHTCAVALLLAGYCSSLDSSLVLSPGMSDQSCYFVSKTTIRERNLDLSLVQLL
ncbi:hypothetical protein C3L33_10141, partial [Rhododendron williamsianum]